nr:immunoglobulin heavy chain junction region [Mus musculus]MBK4188097.1 immunoglobulin heavy chain junction region [Mus musculus]MBK4188110.1 immunoglobulin heavy chain junction region [Mus musculus]
CAMSIYYDYDWFAYW